MAGKDLAEQLVHFIGEEPWAKSRKIICPNLCDELELQRDWGEKRGGGTEREDGE